MKVAIVHYWLVGMRGGEKVLEALCSLFPEADIFTHVCRRDALSEALSGRRITTSFIGSLPFASRLYQRYLPLMPMALEQFDLRDYDLIVSSESGPAKGIVPPPHAVHICYCHSPMRYIWNMAQDYQQRAGPFTRALMAPLSHYLRLWDVSTAARVDDFVANSATVAARIRRYYGRPATVIHPPVDVDSFAAVPASELGDYHLMVGELVGYKRPDLAVKAFNRLGERLVVIGGGEMLQALRALAGPTVTVLGPQPPEILRFHYARCRALIFPGEEDFGIVPVEAMASGRPVIAYGRGGATETVLPGVTGVLFDRQSEDALIEAVRSCAGMSFDPAAIVRHAAQFSTNRFARRMRDHVNAVLQEHGRKPLAGFEDHHEVTVSYGERARSGVAEAAGRRR